MEGQEIPKVYLENCLRIKMVIKDCPYKISEWKFKNRMVHRKPRYPRPKCKYYSKYKNGSKGHVRVCEDPCPLELHRRGSK